MTIAKNLFQVRTYLLSKGPISKFYDILLAKKQTFLHIFFLRLFISIVSEIRKSRVIVL